MKKRKGNKMGKPKTYVVLILDQSGSMSATKEQAVQGYNEQVQQMKLNSKEQDIFCSLITFNGEVFEHMWCKEASELTEAVAEDYITNGSTAMKDAVGYAINKLLETTDSNDENTAYLIVVISDGDDNASKHYKLNYGQLTKRVQATKKWTITYMGCDKKKLEEIAEETSIPLGNMAMWSNKTPELAARGMLRHRKSVDNYYQTRLEGLVSSDAVYSCTNSVANFTEDSVDDVTQSVNALKSVVAQKSIDNIKNTAAKVECRSGPSPFSNYQPVTWNT